MKKLSLLLFLVVCNLAISQESETINRVDKKNEVKLNAFLVLGVFEATYERIIDKKSGFWGFFIYTT